MSISNYQRRTRIIATVGPACGNRIPELIAAGVDVFRLNFSHGTHAVHGQAIANIRAASKAAGRPVGILADLQGPKIRVGKVIDGGITLVNGEEFILSVEACIGQGNRASTIYTPMAEELGPGNRILMDDGLLEVEVVKIVGKDIHTKVINGGVLTSNKGINLPNAALKTPALTEKDAEDLQYLMTQDVDFVALSFVRDPADVQLIRDIMRKGGRDIPVIAKIEKPEALDNITGILDLCYGLMVARGDLGVELPAEQVPTIQKLLVRHCLEAGKPCIVATQMLDSMIRNPRPTRAEASDVANAVLDGASAVMLSGESASGIFPLESISMMDKIVRDVELNFLNSAGLPQIDLSEQATTDSLALAHSVVELAGRLGARCIVCATDSGNTARLISRFRPGVPVLAFADNGNRVLQELSLSWGIRAIGFEKAPGDYIFHSVEDYVSHLNLNPGDLIVVAASLPLGAGSGTNTVKLHRIGGGRIGLGATRF